MHDESFRGALDQIAFRGVGGDDVADCVRDAAFQCQGDPVNGCRSASPRSLWRLLPSGPISYSSSLPTSARIAPAMTVSASIGRTLAHERVHGFRAFACDVDDAALVLHESDWAIWDEQSERNMVQVVGLKRAALEGLDPGLCNLLTKLGILNPVDLRPKALDGLSHTSVRGEPLRLSWHNLDPTRLRDHTGL